MSPIKDVKKEVKLGDTIHHKRYSYSHKYDVVYIGECQIVVRAHSDSGLYVINHGEVVKWYEKDKTETVEALLVRNIQSGDLRILNSQIYAVDHVTHDVLGVVKCTITNGILERPTIERTPDE